jgi:hypothetical protein
MPDQTRQEELDQLVAIIRNTTGDPSYKIERGHPGLFLLRANEPHMDKYRANLVSPRLPHGEMVAYLRAFLDGAYAVERHAFDLFNKENLHRQRYVDSIDADMEAFLADAPD